MPIPILSLTPHWAHLLFSKEKTIEVRRRFMKADKFPTWALVYETHPKKSITGYLHLTHINAYEVDILQDKQGETCIPPDALSQYLQGLDKGIGIHVSNAKRLDKPLPLSLLREACAFSAPQSFCYANDSIIALIRSHHDGYFPWDHR